MQLYTYSIPISAYVHYNVGDTIFGVSMEEKGVSKLLSLEFAREADPVASLV